MIRVVVTGSECTGKTTLARALADHYDTVWVPEYARRFVLAKGAAPAWEDVEPIARGQIALEESRAAGAPDLLIQDTDLLSTVVYSRHYYGACPGWVEDAARDRLADLYLLAGIDVPWSPDGDQRDRGDRREEMQALFREALESRSAAAVEVRGSHAERMTAATRPIDRLLADSPGHR
jgi:NadR type nicotinamide-nucleotide adenylyltransferase